MLNKVESVDKIEVVYIDDIPLLQVRKTVWVEDSETGERIGGATYHRHVVEPDTDLTEEHQRVKDISGAVHTAEVKSAWQAKKAANENSPL